MVRDTFNKARQTEDTHRISMYANENEYEFFSECFVAFYNGEELPAYIVSMLKGALKKMRQCEQCEFYDKEYDELRQSWDDVVVIGQEDKENYYCLQYKQAIADDIVNDKVKCKRFVPRD